MTYTGWYAMKPNHTYLIHMYKKYLELNNLQWLICRKTKLNHRVNESLLSCFCLFIVAIVSLCGEYIQAKFSLSFLCMELNAFEKSTIVPL